ncbi:hypothetical protein CP532_1754 [Ophiocordyceps camponoti-leonardi (nom. inval.)]|nr:hypothetical protein CP532_1754 [Ophiocordyceps camponoti-leonardi (nom. inval.)]
MRARLLAAACCLLRLTAAGSGVGLQKTLNPRLLARSDERLGSVLIPRQNLTAPGDHLKPGPQLRVLCTGDSITAGTFSELDGGDGNGYRLRLRDNLSAGVSADRVVFAGTETAPQGTMSDGFFAAWPGKTIKFMTDHIGPSLKQRPNLILLHAGTNDMNPDPNVSTEGNDPTEAVKRLGRLVDRMSDSCPDAVVLVAMIINTCVPAQAPGTQEFQRQIPAMVRQRFEDGRRVLAVNMTSFPTDQLRDCIHPTNDGYRLFGDYWSDVVTQVPEEWLQAPAEANSAEDPDSPANKLGVPQRRLAVTLTAAAVGILMTW